MFKSMIAVLGLTFKGDSPETLYAKQYSDIVSLKAQQKKSRLRNAVMLKLDARGEETFMDQVDSIDAVDITSRYQATPVHEPSHARRRVSLIGSVVNPVLDPNDKVKMITDPTSSYVMIGSAAMGRKIDDRLIAAATGTAYTGKTGTTAVTLPTTQKVVHGGVGLTIAKWLSGLEILNGNDVDEEEPKFLVISAKQLTNLLNSTEIKSSDYNSVKALVRGEIDTYLGCKVIRSERLGTDSNGDRQVLLFTMTGLGLAISEEVVARIDERADLNYAKQVYFRMHIGATRLEEEKVVEIACNE